MVPIGGSVAMLQQEQQQQKTADCSAIDNGLVAQCMKQMAVAAELEFNIAQETVTKMTDELATVQEKRQFGDEEPAVSADILTVLGTTMDSETKRVLSLASITTAPNLLSQASFLSEEVDQLPKQVLVHDESITNDASSDLTSVCGKDVVPVAQSMLSAAKGKEKDDDDAEDDDEDDDDEDYEEEEDGDDDKLEEAEDDEQDAEGDEDEGDDDGEDEGETEDNGEGEDDEGEEGDEEEMDGDEEGDEEADGEDGEDGEDEDDDEAEGESEEEVPEVEPPKKKRK